MSMEDRDGKIWMDGELVDWRDAKVHVLTHTLHYGCGAFEGVRAYKTAQGTAIFRLREHTERLFNSAKILRMKIPFTLEQVMEAQKEVVRANKLESCYIRPLTWIGSEKLGVSPKGNKIHLMIAAWAWGAYLGEEGLKRGIRVKTSSYTRHHVNITMTQAKTVSNYTNSILANMEATDDGYDEALLLDASGFVSEGAGENLFVVKNGVVYTPDLSAGALNGITRNTILHVCKDLGIALVQAGDRYPIINRGMEEMQDLSLRIVGAIMKLAPWGIAALLARLIATQDLALLETMARFVAVVLGTTLFHGVVVLPGLLWLITRVTPLALWRGGRESFLTALATSSSSATMPITMRVTQTNFGVRPATVGFVVPVGTTMNMDGTALYEAAAALFIASLVGIELSAGQQIVVCVMSMLAAVGAPGIPSAGMVTMVMVLQSVGLPAEAIAIMLPIDRLLDAVRTVVNVEGDIVGSIVVDHVAGADAPHDPANLEARA